MLEAVDIESKTPYWITGGATTTDATARVEVHDKKGATVCAADFESNRLHLYNTCLGSHAVPDNYHMSMVIEARTQGYIVKVVRQGIAQTLMLPVDPFDLCVELGIQ